MALRRGQRGGTPSTRRGASGYRLSPAIVCLGPVKVAKSPLPELAVRAAIDPLMNRRAGARPPTDHLMSGFASETHVMGRPAPDIRTVRLHRDFGTKRTPSKHRFVSLAEQMLLLPLNLNAAYGVFNSEESYMLEKLRTIMLFSISIFVLAAAPAVAQTISNNRVDGGFAAPDGTRYGQIVTAPADQLSAWSTRIGPFPNSSVTPQIYMWDGTSIVGEPIFVGDPVMASTETNPEQTDINIPVGIIPVTAGDQYALMFTVNGTTDSIYFAFDNPTPESDLFVVAPGSDTFSPQDFTDSTFSVTFTAGPTPPAAIPTMSEWAMIFFSVLLAGGAALYIQRRQMAA